ncbi:sensor histidine kinase [Microbacterium gorillae]|uniref:sensor histidine kinase n=1 Tax=Microbacterium gorillae TaxID=1231063 RepID=UPI00058E62EF|nr:HAMP domain-containing sensor histidine kinase [Microbacterium gorillae]
MATAGGSASARRQSLLAILAVVLLVFVAVGVVTFLVMNQRIITDADARLRSALGTDAEDRSGVLTTVDGDTVLKPNAGGAEPLVFLDELVTASPLGPSEVALGVVDGQIVSRSAADARVALSADSALIRGIAKEAASAGTAVSGTIDIDAGPLRYLAVPITVGTDTSPTMVYVRAILIKTSLTQLRDGVLTFSLGVLLALIPIGVATWFLLGTSARAAQRAVGAADTAAPPAAASSPGGTTPPPPPPVSGTHPAPVRRPAPVALRPESVGDVLDLLEGSTEAQRRLLDDVRHELKTPITIVRGHLEIMNSADAADVEAAREIGISELDRMARLVEDIDLLATVEDDEYTMGAVDIATLTDRVGDRVVVLPGHPWAVSDRAPVMVRGNADRLLQAWLALADNAVKYTPSGSPIEIGSTVTGDAVDLWTRDHGPGIAPALRHRIFRRFDRGGGRRDVGGSGLGLAIVETIARSHGGSCTVAETPGGGATFIIRIPLQWGRSATTLPEPIRAGTVIQREETG